MSIRQTARTNARLGICQDSAACCRSMAMIGSNGWPKVGWTAMCAWRSVGLICAGGFYEFYTSTKSPLALELLTRIRTLCAIEAEIRGQSAEHRKQA